MSPSTPSLAHNRGVIKAIIFDFFGVVCSDEYWDAVKQTEGRTDEFLQLADDVSLGKISWGDFVAKLADKTGKPEHELVAGYASQKINLPLLALIQKLHGRYKIALLTNASRETIDLLTQDVPLADTFHEVIVSSDIGLLKPDPKIYQFALRRLGTKPEETIFIDDASRYVLAAQALGIKGMVYHDFGQMKAELARLLADSLDDKPSS